MASPSLRNLALGELSANPETLTVLLAEGETLFVEHKSGIERGDGFQIAKAAASFANTLGGWILVGVDPDGDPIPGWSPPTGGFVDTVRQRLEGQLDPIPSFAAAVLNQGEHSIGVIRVYESADTPHILVAEGSVVVREPAQDSKLRKAGKYEATPIRSHYELAQLTQRGRRAEEAAELRFEEGRLPWIEDSLRFRWTTDATVHGEGPALTLRLTPLTMNARWSEWAVSDTGVEGARGLAADGLEGDVETGQPLPHPAGVAVTSRQSSYERWIPGGHRSVAETSTAVLDAGGMIGLRHGYDLRLGDGLVNDCRSLGDGSDLASLASGLLDQVATTLASAEQLGRFVVHAVWLGFGELYRVDPADPKAGAPPGFLSTGGTFTVDGTDDRTELNALARRWSLEILRSSGVARWQH